MWVWALPWGFPWSEFVAIAAIGATLLHLANSPPGSGSDSARVSPGLGPWLLLAFGLWVLASYLNAEDEVKAYIWMLEYLKIIVMFGVGIVVIKNPRQIWILYLLATISIGYISYELNYKYLVNGFLWIYRRGYSGMDNNGAALMIAMGFPLALYAWDGTRRWWRWIYLAFLPLIVHAVLMSYSRGAMLALIAATPVMLLGGRFFRWRIALVFVVVGSMIPTLAGNEIRQRFFSIEQYQEDDSANSRMQSWQAAIRIANEHPILGAGPRNSNLLSYKFGADIVGRTIHSQYLQTAADLGWVGLAFYLSFVAAALRSIMIARRQLRRRTDEDARMLLSVTNGILGSLTIFFFGAFFLSLEVFELPYMLMLLAFLLRGLSQEPVAQAVPAERTIPPRQPQLASVRA